MTPLTMVDIYIFVVFSPNVPVQVKNRTLHRARSWLSVKNMCYGGTVLLFCGPLRTAEFIMAKPRQGWCKDLRLTTWIAVSSRDYTVFGAWCDNGDLRLPLLAKASYKLDAAACGGKC